MNLRLDLKIFGDPKNFSKVLRELADQIDNKKIHSNCLGFDENGTDFSYDWVKAKNIHDDNDEDLKSANPFP